MEDLNRVKGDDPFLLQYQMSDLRTASEFLTIWLPFLTRDLCDRCSKTLSLRIRSLDSAIDGGDNQPVPSSSADDDGNCCDNNCDKNSTGSCSNSIGSWKDSVNGVAGSERSDSVPMEASTSGNGILGRAPAVSTMPHMSWADMALEDELGEEKEQQEELNKQGVDSSSLTGELSVSKAVLEKPKLPREQREYIRFTKMRRKKDFICLERFKGKHVNILEGLELHEGVFSAVEQKRIVDLIHDLQEKGKRSELKERTYTAPQKWMKGKGRVTIQFGCCYNYAVDKHGNPPGILQNESVDPIPFLFKVMIRRLVRWHVLPPTCVPDSCIVNIYDEGDCIPPHIDNHDFVRPFCTVSFLSECNILFGSNLKALGPGQFDGPVAIPLPVGSVLVLNGNGADIAKHCVPSVPTKRISITFRKMDERKQPVGFVPELDLQGIQPLSYELDKVKKPDSPKSEPFIKRRPFGKEGKKEAIGFLERDSHSEPRHSTRSRQGPPSKRRTNVDLGNY